MTPDEARELREISEMFDYQMEIVVKEEDDGNQVPRLD
jgi:hypothetical protein